MSTGQLAQDECIDALKRALDLAPHGAQTALVQQAARDMGKSKQTIYDRLRARGWSSGRKLRSDRTDSDCPMHELYLIAAVINARPRENGKIIATAGGMINMLRANKEISTPLSNAALIRLLRLRRLDSKTLNQPSPHTSTQSRHPNHVWQCDSSICVLYYLPGKQGLRAMRADKFNLRKPDMLAKVLHERVLRYCCTDHASGSVFSRYYLSPGENVRTLFQFLMEAFTKRPNDVMHGVPLILELDMASANTSHAVKNLCTQLGVRVIAHAPGNPRANGQVEQSHNMIERGYEARLAFANVDSLEALNSDLEVYLADLNNRAIHSRHGNTRSAMWQKIGVDELRICPLIERCQALMMSKTEERRVDNELHIQYTVPGYKTAWYSVDHVPEVRVGDLVKVSVNAYRDAEVFVQVEREGQQLYFACQPRATNQYGFFTDAPMRGESYHAPKDSAACKDRKALSQIAYGTTDRLERDKRMAKGPAFGGRLDPMADLRAAKADHPAYMQRKGTEITLPTMAVTSSKLTRYELLRACAAELGRVITPEENAYLSALNQEFSAADVAELVAQLRRPQPTERPRLVAVR